MNTCSFTIHLKIISACSEVFVEHKVCYGELKEASSSLQLVPLTHEASPNNKNWREFALVVFGTLSLWAPKTLDLWVALISWHKEI